MWKYLSSLSALLLFILASAMPAAAVDLRAGAAKAVITPDIHAARVYIAGYGKIAWRPASTTIFTRVALPWARVTRPWWCVLRT